MLDGAWLGWSLVTAMKMILMLWMGGGTKRVGHDSVVLVTIPMIPLGGCQSFWFQDMYRFALLGCHVLMFSHQCEHSFAPSSCSLIWMHPGPLFHIGVLGLLEQDACSTSMSPSARRQPPETDLQCRATGVSARRCTILVFRPSCTWNSLLKNLKVRPGRGKGRT